jgi:hypothetical protein
VNTADPVLEGGGVRARARPAPPSLDPPTGGAPVDNPRELRAAHAAPRAGNRDQATATSQPRPGDREQATASS